MKNSNHINLNPYPLKLYGRPDGASQVLALRIARLLKTKLSPVIYKEFKDGTFLIHHTESIRDRDLYVILQPRFGQKEKLSYDLDKCESLVFALRQGEPARITVVMPCLPYARQDKSSNHREPVLVQKYQCVYRWRERIGLLF
jgi:ribose-phosphate pyrophosphokinase